MSAEWPEGLPPLEGKPASRRREVIHTARLSNGMTVWAVRREGLPLAALGLVLMGGRSDDRPGHPGLSSLLASGLKEGSVNLSSEKLFSLLQEYGGDLHTEATADSLNLDIRGLSSGLERFIDVLAGLVRSPAFPEEGVARVRALAQEDLETQESEPSFLAARTFASAIFGAHPYRIVAPTRETIDDASPELLRAEASRRFQPSRTSLIAVGDLDPAATIRMVENAFGDWRESDELFPEVPEASVSRGVRRIHAVPRPGSVQTYLMVGNPGVSRRDRDAHAVSLAVTLYGGAFTSRLVTNLRTEKGYTYSPGAVSVWQRGRGFVRSTAAVRNEVTGAALNEILYEMDRMGSSNVTEEELERGRMRDLGLRATSLQTSAGLLPELGSLLVSGLPPEALHEPEDVLFQITAQDIRRVSRSYLASSRAQVVAVGDPDVIREELSAFGEIAIV